jgi:hypothetical protein
MARKQRRKIDLAVIVHKSAFSRAEFCARNGICLATFNNYLRDGVGPVVMRVGQRVLISAEAEAAWKRKLEQQPLPQRGRRRKEEAAAAVSP